MEENNEGLNQEVEENLQTGNEIPLNNEERVKFKPLGQMRQEKPKKKKGKAGVIIIILFLLLATIIGGAAYYYFEIYTNPKVIYSQIVKTGISNLMVSNEENISTFKGNTKLDVDIDLEERYMEKGVEEIINTINDIDAAINVQVDIEEEKIMLNLDSNYQDEELVNMDMLMDIKSDKAYLKLEQFYDKVLEAEEEDVDLTDLEELFGNLQETMKSEDTIFAAEADRKKATEILQKEFANVIKDEYVSKSKENITIDGKEISADNYIFKITLEQIAKEIKIISENLKNNEEFLNCFKEKEDIKKLLEEMSEELDDSEINQEATLYVKIYKTGLMQEVVRLDFEMEIDKEKLIIKTEKMSDKNKFYINFQGKEICTGTFNLETVDKNNTKLNFTLKIEDLGEFAADIEYGYTINEKIDTMDVENAVKSEDITQDEMLKITEKLEESKLYEVVEKFSTDSEDEDNLIQQPELPNEEIELPTEQPNNTENENASDIEKNISANGVYTEGKTFIVFATNNNTVAVDMDIEVEYYDENGTFVGSTEEYLTAVGAGKEVAVEMWNSPAVFSTYKIYIEAEETSKTDYSNQIEMTHNNNGQNVVVQVKNNSTDTIDYITVSAVYYKKGKVVGITDGMASKVKTGRAGNFNLHFPYDSEYEDIEFDDYKVFVTEVYSYNW